MPSAPPALTLSHIHHYSSTAHLHMRLQIGNAAALETAASVVCWHHLYLFNLDGILKVYIPFDMHITG
jgi:hypothetical protein